MMMMMKIYESLTLKGKVSKQLCSQSSEWTEQQIWSYCLTEYKHKSQAHWKNTPLSTCLHRQIIGK